MGTRSARPVPQRSLASGLGSHLSLYHCHSGHSSARDGNVRCSEFTLPYTVRARSSTAPGRPITRVDGDLGQEIDVLPGLDAKVSVGGPPHDPQMISPGCNGIPGLLALAPRPLARRLQHLPARPEFSVLFAESVTSTENSTLKSEDHESGGVVSCSRNA